MIISLNFQLPDVTAQKTGVDNVLSQDLKGKILAVSFFLTECKSCIVFQFVYENLSKNINYTEKL